jgi:hypothetical protein
LAVRDHGFERLVFPAQALQRVTLEDDDDLGRAGRLDTANEPS